MIFVLILLCADGFYIFDPIIKISFIGTILLFLICLSYIKLKFHLSSFIFICCILVLLLTSSLLNLSSQNLIYLSAELGLFFTCILIIWASLNQIILLDTLFRLAAFLIFGSFFNYFIDIALGIDLILELSSLFSIDSATSRYSLETVYSFRVPRMYFLSSEPSTHAITVFCLYVAIKQNTLLSNRWEILFFTNILCTASLTGMILFLAYNLWYQRKLVNVVLIIAIIIIFLLFVSMDFSTIAKLYNLFSDPRIEQFEFALEKIRIWPQDINSIPDIGSSVLSLWIYIYLANGIIISTLLFIILSFVRIIPPINLFMFFIIFLVIPISYFVAASFLMTPKR